MDVVRREIASKAVLTKTGIPGYDGCLNPYVGCEHGCSYCYASFMKRFTGHLEPCGVERLGDAAGEILVDRMNYSGKVAALYRREKLERYLDDAWFDRTAAELRRGFEQRGVAVSVLF